MQIDNSFLDMNSTLPQDFNRTYHLSVKVEVKNLTLVSDGVQYESKRVFLIPQESLEMVLFYNTYLPEAIVEVEEEDHTRELVFVCPMVARAFRGYLTRGDKHCPKKHIGIMTDDLKNLLLSMNGKTIRIDSIPSSEEDKFDV